jgi:hypothetical protein
MCALSCHNVAEDNQERKLGEAYRKNVHKLACIVTLHEGVGSFHCISSAHAETFRGENEAGD